MQLVVDLLLEVGMLAAEALHVVMHGHACTILRLGSLDFTDIR